MNIKSWLLVAISLGVSGCGFGGLFGLTVHTQKTIARPPANVQVIVNVADGKQPVSQLAEHNFDVYENDLHLDRDQIGLRLLPKDSLTAGMTVLLLDVSGSPDENTLRRIERGATHFVERVSVTQSVTVVAFDGSPRPREVARFSKVEQATERAVPSLTPFLSQDRSRDLHGAMLSAIKGVQLELAKTKKEAVFGTIVTVLHGPDLAGRTSEATLRQAIFASGYDFYSLSPEGASFDGLSLAGHTKRYDFATIDTLPMQLTDIGAHVRGMFNSHYVLSYCSPARAGERKLKVVVNYTDPTKQRGSTKSKFDATGFVGGCDQTSPKPASAVAPVATEANAEDPVIAPPDSGNYE